MGVRLFFIADANSSFIPIGLEEYFIMPKTIDRVITRGKDIIVLLRERGSFIGYAEEKVYLEDMGYVEGIIRFNAKDKVIFIKKT